MPTAPLPSYTVRLRVVDASRTGVAGATVRALDHDRGREPNALGTGVTGGDGSIVLTFAGKAAGGASEGDPELFVLVNAPDGTLLHQSKPLALKTAEHDMGDLVAHSRVIPATPGGLPVAPVPQAPAEVVGEAGPAPRPNDPSSAPGSNRFHGSARRDAVVPRSPFYHGPFGRLFRQLPAWVPPGADEAAKEAAVRAIAALMVEPEGEPDPSGDNDVIPAGYTYFGQFVDHDITFDPASSLAKLNDPDRLINFRTPRFDLDSLYGEGPDDEPFMYDQRSDRAGEFLIGKGLSPAEADLPRNEQDTALTGDPRNDENVIVAQLQLAFLRLHNALLLRVKAEEGLTGREAFTRAQTLVRWHYQWVVIFDYLPRICGREVTDALLVARDDGTPGFRIDLKLYRFRDAPFLPVEFSAAAYRFGHSQIRHRYDLNALVTRVPIFLPPEQKPGVLADLRGFRRLPGMWSLDWRRFLRVDAAAAPQSTRRIDSRLSRALSAIPAGPDPAKGAPLAALNLLRGFRLGLPSGQAVARAMGEREIANVELGLDEALAGSEAPLWFYLLKEAELRADGRHLGPVGARIVAETLLGLAKADPSCFLNIDPGWRPALAFGTRAPIDPAGDALDLAGLIRAAGMAGDPFQR